MTLLAEKTAVHHCPWKPLVLS